MSATENLASLRSEEDALYERSLAAIEENPELKDHWLLVSEAMNLIYAFSKEHRNESDDELTLQYLGIRLFNASAASIRLAMAGYYQKSFDQVRDVLETYFLADYLRDDPRRISEWKNADKKARIAKFGPGIAR